MPTPDCRSFSQQSTPQQVQLLPALLAALQPQWTAGEILNVEFLPGGYSNLNFTFEAAQQRYVVRIPTRNQPFVDRSHEQRWYQQLPAGLSVEPLLLDAGTGVMITPWMEGRLLVDAWPDLTTLDLCNYLQGLHQRLPEPHRDYNVAQVCRALGGTGNAGADNADGNPPTVAKTILQPCHNDLNPCNILVTDSGWVTLDWEFVGNNDPLFDLVALHQGLALPADSLPELVAQYAGSPQTSLIENWMERLPHVYRGFWQRELAWSQFQLANGNQREEIHQQHATARQALTRF